MNTASVRKQIEVDASQARAFRVFTEEHGAWWPLASHHIGTAAAETAIIEPKNGGRWFERAADGSECVWGRVLVWDPPGRLVLSWEITENWQHDAALKTEVEVRFVALGPARTRIELEHRQLDRYGPATEQMRGVFDSEGGWGGILRRFAQRAVAVC
jgi:uncharacterized protein YndB with AHSA1/START domain